MAFSLKNIIPWGRSYDEYVAMFALSQEDLCKSILGCGDGPAAFNTGLTNRGGRVVSVDPIYQFNAEEITCRIEEAYGEVMEQMRHNIDDFVWERIRSVDELGDVRMAAMREFLADYPAGLSEGRYVNAALPELPFADNEFELALCSHYLFLYSKQLSLEFHIRSIQELCRVATEVRIFPILELGAKHSRHLESVILQLKKDFEVDIITVPYEFKKGSNQMLKITAG